MNNNDKQFLAQKIRTQYVTKEPSELDALRALDSKVKRPANVFAYTFGSISAIIMGAGMSLVMTELGALFAPHGWLAMAVGVLLGVVGGGMAAAAYPVYSMVVARRRKKLAPEILRLSDELMK